MKLAALDLGSNSFHLLVADVDESGELTKVHSQKDVLGLGSVVQERGQLSEEAMTAAFASVKSMALSARELNAEKLLAVGTSALRDARNGEAFCELCRDELELDIEVLSGADEARLAYLGARSAIASTTGKVLVADVGGGSVELAVGERDGCDAAQSLPLGFLRLAHAFPLAEPGGYERLSRYVQVECEKARWQLGRFETLLLSGGTARAIGKLLGGGVATANAEQTLELCRRASQTCPTQLQALGIEPSRARALAPGAAVIAGILAGLGQRELRISSRGLREGVLLREHSRRAPTQAA